jgi:hypothetical protein
MTALCNFRDSLTCPACGYVAKHPRTLRQCRPVPPKVWQPIMVGDLVEQALTSVGITKERVEKLTRTEGKPGGCGCGARKKWMNEQGAKVQHAIRDAGMAASKFYFGK